MSYMYGAVVDYRVYKYSVNHVHGSTNVHEASMSYVQVPSPSLSIRKCNFTKHSFIVVVR